MRRSLGFAVLLGAASGACAHGYKAIKDWVGGCDNTRYCSALGLAKEDSESYALLHFKRGPAAGDQVRSIRLRVNHEISRDKVWTLQADDAELLQFNDRHLVDADSGPGIDFVIETSDELEALMGAMRSADALTVVGDSGPVGRISLSGASAIMLWIDEQQGRLGTSTALHRRGEKSPQTLPAVTLPRLKAVPATPLGTADVATLSASTRARLPPDSCESLEPDSGIQDEAWTVEGERTLVKLQCYGGAYNFGSSWFLLDQRGALTPLSFPIPNDDGGAMGSSTDLVNADFDPNSGRLSSFNKGRGMGDCGSFGEWLWDGNAFQLASYRSMGDCRGVSSDLWPRLWQSAP